jgi:cell cycle sensor histidine kinase DivJ
VAALATIHHFVDALLHPSARADAMTSARHRAFIAPRLLGSFAALAMFPLYLVWRGAPSALEVMVFAWLIAPILLAYYLSRTGRYESAHMLSSLALASLVTTVAAKTGGIESFAAIWLVLVPLEASLSASRRVVGIAAVLALGAALGLLVCGVMNLLPRSEMTEFGQGMFMALGTISATLYGAGLAFGAESLARTSFWLLYAEEDRYRLLARNMSDVISRHGRGGEVLFISPAVESLLGAPASTLMGHGLFERVHVADRPAYLTALAGAASDGESHNVEFRIRRGALAASFADTANTLPRDAAPNFVWLEMRCRPLDPAGATAGAEHEVVAVMRDVTSRMRQEQALRDARVEAEHANAAKSRFLATMSHELRTPLNAIIGFSEMIAQERELSLSADKRQEYAKLINDSGNHLLSVVNDILEMSKIESGTFDLDPEQFSARDVVANCCDLMVLKARETGVELVMNAGDDLPRINADKRAFKQVLLNLLSNAIKFTERGGKVSVGVTVEGARLSLCVTDTGVGIDPADVRRLGEAFFQTGKTYNRRHEGTGLGLSIVKGLVALHHGEIRFESKLGEGTRVTVLLPLDFAPPAKMQVTNVTAIGASRADAPQRWVKKSA